MKGKPAIRNHWLLILSGLMWTGVGILLNSFAIKWLVKYQSSEVVAAESVGIIMGIIIAIFGFSKIAHKNIRRILTLPDKVCVFAFQEWKSYILIAVMMTMGIFLRTSGLVPKLLLSPLYVGIGSALFFSSFLYYKSFLKYQRAD